ncbi:MAG TPA: SCO family protein [Candidatus Tectomicrobia bacterium]|nr:SCO family protein [Candidatus Tectomicrobia bacterium]
MTPTTQPEERQERLARVLLWGLLAVVLMGVVGRGVRSLIWQESTQDRFPGASSARLPIYGAVPHFALTDQRNRPVRRADLEGKVWIASFMFTNCPEECPVMTAEMAQFQSDLAPVADFRLVSISVDPERDTPSVLSQYADRFNADPERWLFLTGDKRTIYRLAREGFRLGIVDPEEQSHLSPPKDRALGRPTNGVDRLTPSSVGQTLGWLRTVHSWLRHIEPSTAFADHGRAQATLHSTRFVLLDRRAHIRGYYESREAAALQRLRQHLQMLFRET